MTLLSKSGSRGQSDRESLVIVHPPFTVLCMDGTASVDFLLCPSFSYKHMRVAGLVLSYYFLPE